MQWGLCLWMDDTYTYIVSLLAWVVQKNHAFLSNSLIELIYDGRACHILWPQHRGVDWSPLLCLFSVSMGATLQCRLFSGPLFARVHALKACCLKTFSFISLKCAVSIGCTCSQGYHPGVSMEKAQTRRHKWSFPGKCRQVFLFM